MFSKEYFFESECKKISTKLLKVKNIPKPKSENFQSENP
jgi:hypothetical protein